MDNPFNRTLRSLAGDPSRRFLGVVATVVSFLGCWAAFFLLARVPVYGVSREARLEAAAQATPVAAPVAGRLQAFSVTLGREVAAGEVLFVLEADLEQRRREEEQARGSGLGRQLEALRQERANALAALEEARGDRGPAAGEAAARLERIGAAADLARDEAARAAALHGRGLLSEADLRRAAALAGQRAAELVEAQEAAQRVGLRGALDLADRRREISRLDGEIAEIEGAAAAGLHAAARLAAEEERRRVRAPVAGVVAEVAPLAAGAVVVAGQVLAVVVPRSELRLAAAFAPAEVLGRIRAGQPASVRFDGFSWLEYGSVPARVAEVSAEPRDGLLWVYLAADFPAGSRIPAQHGLPGEVSVELERVAPWSLILRSAGQLREGGR